MNFVRFCNRRAHFGLGWWGVAGILVLAVAGVFGILSPRGLWATKVAGDPPEALSPRREFSVGAAVIEVEVDASWCVEEGPCLRLRGSASSGLRVRISPVPSGQLAPKNRTLGRFRFIGVGHDLPAWEWEDAALASKGGGEDGSGIPHRLAIDLGAEEGLWIDWTVPPGDVRGEDRVQCLIASLRVVTTPSADGS